jgi:hypothetical protein
VDDIADGYKKGVVHATTPEKKMKRFSPFLSASVAKDRQSFSKKPNC